MILFYQALFNNSSSDVEMIWAGFVAGCVVVAILFFALQMGVLKIPLKPFFLFTSVLMYLLAITFAGGGVRELQEGGVFGQTPLEFVPTIDVLGIYPTVETFGLQVALLILGVGAFLYRKRQAAIE